MQAERQTLPGVLRAAAKEYATREAIVDGDLSLTYGELHEQVRRTAAALIGLGLGKDDRVCLWAPNSWRWEVLALAVTYAGGTLVPVNTRYTGPEAVDMVARTRAKVVAVADGFLGRRQYDELAAAAEAEDHELPNVLLLPYDASTAGGEGIVPWEGLDWSAAAVDEATVERRADEVTPDDVADILFTSGTSGRSKGARSAHRQVVSVAAAWRECGQVTAADRYLVVNPFFHSFGYKCGIVVGLLAGATVAPQAVFDVTETFRLVEKERISVLPGAPAIHQAMLESPERKKHDLSSLRLAVTGAATVPVALVERMQSEMGFDTVLTAYGLTEAVVATMCRPGDEDTRVANTCGRAAAGLEVRIAKPGGNEPPPADEEGEILLRGENVMLDYLDDPEATAEAIDEDGWLHTGDVGRLDQDGYLRITDRLKDVFIVGGFNVYPAEVEQALARLDGVLESAVVGVPDHRLGEVGHAFVVRRVGADLDEDAVLAHARERLANFKVPRGVTFVDDLPRNPSGKVLKRELRSS
ncbi:FadD3 family acyl-CoA ligase [Haloactinomyces albus]|uniref:Acyl-CoA synthetase (AMP-forming)/AMP-acid ligase II n=1 Tax=Haloactinomyces albus TaxID=1352928 RepID=A0AAE4CRL2_9ACTN|nr:FadD3 family acyl-CoA ligase [Haloactinomyces albus]MDR7303823.1 acyl-CoA synthetase (AMP-forming)/AMP-acid ligase II [Haloactinomyces albus]